MDGILTLNTIKNVFSALGAKTSDSNYAVALLDKTSAEPKGMMDFANLASVLGAGFQEARVETDVNTECFHIGVRAYQVVGSTAENAAFNVDHCVISMFSGYSITFNRNTLIGGQLALRANGEAKLRCGVTQNGITTYSAWKSITMT